MDNLTREHVVNDAPLSAKFHDRPAPFNGMCRVLDCFFGTQFDPSDDTWDAIQVYRDGNTIIIEGGFASEDEAELCAGAERARQIKDNSQFGVGA